MKVLFLFDKDGDSCELSMLVKCCKILLNHYIIDIILVFISLALRRSDRLKTCKLLVGVTYKLRTYLKCC